MPTEPRRRQFVSTVSAALVLFALCAAADLAQAQRASRPAVTQAQPLPPQVRERVDKILARLRTKQSIPGTTTLLVMGDYGTNSTNELNVVNNVIKILDPGGDSIIVTVGDNNYKLGAPPYENWAIAYGSYNLTVCAGTLGEFYKRYIYGGTCPDAAKMPPAAMPGDPCAASIDLPSINFYPAPGNEDLSQNNLFGSGLTGEGTGAFTGYFPWARNPCGQTVCNSETNAGIKAWVQNKYGVTKFECADLPDNAYDVVRGSVHLFMLDSTSVINDNGCNNYNPQQCYSDGGYPTNSTAKKLCAQALWLSYASAQDTSGKAKIAVFHRPPYSSAHHPSCKAMQYDFRGAGMTMVLTGHNHNYTRLTTTVDGGSPADFRYLTVGTGGYYSNLDTPCFVNNSTGMCTAPGMVQNYNGVTPTISSIIGEAEFGALQIVSSDELGIVDAFFYTEDGLANNNHVFTDYCEFVRGGDGAWTSSCWPSALGQSMLQCNTTTGCPEN